jgi:hypothetical protein
MGFVKHGGFIITTPKSNLVDNIGGTVSQEKLREIARILGVTANYANRLKEETIRTIFVYAPPEDKK